MGIETMIPKRPLCKFSVLGVVHFGRFERSVQPYLVLLHCDIRNGRSYWLNTEAMLVYDPVDCMTCLVAEARRSACE